MSDSGSQSGTPWTIALRLLNRRDYSRSELRKRLGERGCDAEQIESVIKRCNELGYLDDRRYALNRARSLMRRGRAVGGRLLVDLRQRGIDAKLAQEALDEACRECNEEETLRELVARRYPGFDYNSAPANERRRVVHFLQRRGFALDRIMDQLKRKGHESHHDDRQ